MDGIAIASTGQPYTQNERPSKTLGMGRRCRHFRQCKRSKILAHQSITNHQWSGERFVNADKTGPLNSFGTNHRQEKPLKTVRNNEEE